MVNQRQYAFEDLTVFLLGRKVTGLRGISYITTQEKERVYGAGNNAQTIGRGNIACEGSITLLQSELEALIQAAGGSITKLRGVNITASYGESVDTIVIDNIIGAEFTEMPKSMNQNDKFQEITIPFICLDIQYQVV